MLKLPAATSPVRELVDMDFLATLGSTAQLSKLPAFRQALHSAKELLAADKAAKSVNVLTLRADGALWLVTVTRRTWKRVWNFGNPIPA